VPEAPSADPRVRAAIAAHWRRNVRLMTDLLAVWAFVGLGCGVLFAEWLNRFSLGGFPLGFWFAQQGSILVFVGLSFALYLSIAWRTRVRDTQGFYVAGRGVPAAANGMATAAD
jgi:putative solute:sodium symporter small subunit